MEKNVFYINNFQNSIFKEAFCVSNLEYILKFVNIYCLFQNVIQLQNKK